MVKIWRGTQLTLTNDTSLSTPRRYFLSSSMIIRRFLNLEQIPQAMTILVVQLWVYYAFRK